MIREKFRDASGVIPGPSDSEEPGIHNRESCLWILGLRASPASRNDKPVILTCSETAVATAIEGFSRTLARVR
jgi:hypothetical protein